MGRRKTYTDDDFLAAVPGKASLTQIARALGLCQNGKLNKTFKADAARLNITLPNGHKRPKLRGCEFVGCKKNHYARGYCAGHYRQLREADELKPLRPRRGGI